MRVYIGLQAGGEVWQFQIPILLCQFQQPVIINIPELLTTEILIYWRNYTKKTMIGKSAGFWLGYEKLYAAQTNDTKNTNEGKQKYHKINQQLQLIFGNRNWIEE